MDYQRLLSVTRRALQDYDMIDTGDKVAVACSGGKDSVALCLAMKGLEKFYPKTFTMKAFTVDLGFHPGADYEALQRFFEERDIPFEIIRTEISDIVFGARKEDNPCSLCASLRKGALYTQIVSEGYQKVCLGHHMEDVIETFLLSLMYEGRFHTLEPYTRLSDTGLTVIRPFLYVHEKEIVHFAGLESLPVVKNPCPADGNTKREDMKNLLKQLNSEDHQVSDRMFGAIKRSSLEGWDRIDEVAFNGRHKDYKAR